MPSIISYFYSAVCIGQDTRETIFIPETSIFNRISIDQNNVEGSVFVINGSSLTERKVVFGPAYGEDREIIAGLKAGELVVLRPDTELREGSNVTLLE